MSTSTPTQAMLPDVGAPFWNGLKERKLMLQFDAASGQAQFYPRPQSLYSEAGTQWREATGRGVILALTKSRVAPPQLASQVPYALALVRLDEGPRMMARVNAPYESLRIGDAVRVDWDVSLSGGKASFPIFKLAGGKP